jgi:multidrug efflux pump subunit AcrB
MSGDRPPADALVHGGALAWMTRNSVAANLIMAALIFGGLLFLTRVKQEVFPEFELDIITVVVPYPGASPEEVEKAVTRTIEETVRGIDGIKAVTSVSSEGAASVMIELLLDANPNKALNDVKAAVDRIASFPANVEEPITSRVDIKREVVSLVLYGEASEKAIRALAESVRDGLLADPRITQVELTGVRPLEISVEVPRENLRAYGLTLDQVAAAIRDANVEVPAGAIKTERGEILLRTAERRDFGRDFHDIVVLSGSDGSRLRLGELASIDDSFRETDQEAYFNGKPGVALQVYRVGDETPTQVSDAVHEYIEANERSLPVGMHFVVSNDRSEMYRQRIDLLLDNAYLGLALVLLCLGLFLEIRLAFWVTVGIPVSFLGAILFLPATGVSLNMISLFAFIVTLGIVVDDAIVVGEAVYKRRRDGLPAMRAAVAGVNDVVMPVTFSVLTTIVAFSPLMFVPGDAGKFFRNIPTVVILVLAISLIESLLVLPAHLGHENPIARMLRGLVSSWFGPRLGPFGWLARAQERFSEGYESFIERRYRPVVEKFALNRWIVIAGSIALLIVSLGVIAGGRIDFTFMPKIESDSVSVQLSMPYGTPAADSKRHMDHIVTCARDVLEVAGGVEVNALGIFSQVGASSFGSGSTGPTGGHLAEVVVFMKPLGERRISARELAEKWRGRIGDIPGADSLKVNFTAGAVSSAPISILLSHTDVIALEKASRELAGRLRDFKGVKDIDDGVALGKRQLDFELKPEARSLGITEMDLARQVRSAFFGAEASRQQRGRDEVRVYVRLPEAERTSLHDLEEMLIRTANRGEVPLAMAATIDDGHAYTFIQREDGRRVLKVEADVVDEQTNANKIMAELRSEVLPELMKAHPGLSYDLGGEQKRQVESMDALADGFKMALILMFALMAIPLRSYVQPVIIMIAIPFGIVGALGGHLLLGYDLSILSAMGVVALSGVVVNDSLVLTDAVNGFRREGWNVHDAVIMAGVRRFRPIMLTSLTTFSGLAPMIFDTNVQTYFLVPMAISLGFGVLFATFITLLLVPCLYLALEDCLRAGAGLFNRIATPAPDAARRSD